ncbi:MAG: serine/threonine-protein kinase [Rikenellaceae bacterium]
MKIGENIGGYDLIDEIPGGGMADVYVAKKSNVKYALKTLKDGASEDDIKRFKREVRMLIAITDDNVIEVVDSNLDSKSPYYVMPLCDDSLHNKCKTMSEQDKIEYSVQFCKGILAIHNNGITHRDIKPQNALLLSDVVKISDLGLGRFEIRDSTTITTSQWGTEGYFPPEYLSDTESFKRGSIAGDIFMIGKSLYYIFSGGLDPQNVELDKVNPFVATIINQCTRLAPIERYNSVKNIVDKLEQYKVAYIFQQTSPMSFDEIINKHGTSRSTDYCEDVFQHLCFIGTDNITMADSLSKLTSNDLKLIFQHHASGIDTFVKYFDESIRNNERWIQCEDVESFTKLARVLIPLCSNIYSKQLLLALSIEYATNFNRWNAMTTVGYILNELSSADIRELTPLLLENKDSLRDMSSCFRCSIPFNISSLIR